MDIDIPKGFQPVRRCRAHTKITPPYHDSSMEPSLVLGPEDIPEVTMIDDVVQEQPTAQFPKLNPRELNSGRCQVRRIVVPPHRFTPIKSHWKEIVEPIVSHMKLQIRMNIKRKTVEIRTSKETSDISALQKSSEFVKAFVLGFDIQDAIALLRLDDLYIETFEVKDVKTLTGDHLSRCIGRISGKDGKTKYAIENSTRTRIVLADSKIHILGSFQNIRLARNAICSLILGSPPGKVHNHLRTITKRLRERL
eukprot:GHVL01037691.1.p1 GENE.GHVL01037691.1~~GHVL01037691.1.p1  ORF type:complete len:252 (+),score=34.18 GHVL01037691.1:72-827(+)